MGLDEKKQQKEIGGVKYDMIPLGFAIGRPMLVRLIGIISPILGASAQGGGAVFDALPRCLSDDDIKYLAKNFGNASWYYRDDEQTAIPLVEENQNEHFAGRYLEFVQWLTFGCEVNFKGFFVGIKAEATKLAAMIPKNSTSTPGSG